MDAPATPLTSAAAPYPGAESGAAVGTLDEELRVAQSLHLVGQLPALVLSNVGGAVVAYIAVWRADNWGWLTAWLTVVWLLCVPMAVNWIRLHDRPAPERVSHRRIRRARGHSLALGVVWSLILILLMQPDVPHDVQLIVTGAMLVLGLGACVSMAPIPESALAYSLPVLASMTVFVGAHDTTPLYAHTVLNVFVCVACLFFLRQGWSGFRRSVEAARERTLLAESRAREEDLRRSAERSLADSREEVESKSASLQAVQRHMQSIVEALPNPVIVFARDGSRILFGNQRAAELVGTPLESVYRMSAPDFFASKADYERLLERLKSDEAVTGLEARLRQHGGGEIWTSLAAIVMSYAGEPAVLATIDDVTERKRYEMELHAAKDLAEGANRAKSQFLANMSHELRTPLNAVLGYSELMADGVYGALPDRAAGVLARIRSNSQHLLGLINDVLDLSKIEAGQLVLSLESYSLSELVATVQAGTESLARAKNLEFRTRVDPGMPPGYGDARRLAQVLMNLVGNAIKFTDKGWVEIRARCADGVFTLEVQDTGPGIDRKDHARIFEEFQQVDNTSTRNKGGSGLGLAISRRIVALHGGAIDLESTAGAGATFRVTWPVSAPVPEAA